MDMYHTQVPSLWKGNKTVVGFTHSISRLFRSYTVSKKSQAPDVYELHIAFCSAKGIAFTWCRVDGAHELKGTKIVPIAKQHAFRITTNTPGSSRQNL